MSQGDREQVNTPDHARLMEPLPKSILAGFTQTGVRNLDLPRMTAADLIRLGRTQKEIWLSGYEGDTPLL